MAGKVEIEKGDTVKAREAMIANPAALLKQIGSFIVSRSQRAFDLQKKGRVSWPPRKVPNVAGIISDLSRGKSPPPRRFEPRKAGVDTGMLKRSISWRITEPMAVEVGTALPYASKIQFGGSSVLRVTKVVKQGLARFLKKRPEWRKSLGFLFRKDGVTVNVPPRPFVTVEPDERAELAALVQSMLTRPDRPPPTVTVS